MSEVDSFGQIMRIETFLGRIYDGCGRMSAAVEVGWSPAELRSLMRDPEFADLVVAAEERRLESIEEVAFTMAREKNTKMVSFILERQGQHRGWGPVQRIDVNRNVKVDITAKLSAVEALREVMRSGADIAALQPGGGLDVIDAEVVDDG